MSSTRIASLRRRLDAATDADLPIYVSAYSLVELVYAVEKATNPLTEDDRQAILEELTQNDAPFEVLPVTAAVANRLRPGLRSRCGRWRWAPYS